MSLQLSSATAMVPAVSSRCLMQGALPRRLVLVLVLALSLVLASFSLASEGVPDARPLLTGVAVDALGRGVPGVDIVLSSQEGGLGAAQHTVRSDENGRFIVGGLTPGAYRVVAIKGGYSILVGKIDTLLRDSLELVLRPSGQAGPPGSQPVDASWILRLAARDRLESIRHAVATAGESEARRQIFDGPVMIEYQTTQSQGDGLDYGGLSATIAGELPVAGIGQFGVSYQHRTETAAEMLKDSSDVLGLRWVPDRRLSSLVPTTHFDLLRQSRLAERLAGDAYSRYESEGARFQTTWAFLSPGSAIEARIDGALLSGRQADPGSSSQEWQNHDAHRLALSLGMSRAWGEHHELISSLRLRDAGGVLVDAPEGGELVVSLLTGADGDAALGVVSGPTVDLAVTDRWTPRSGLGLHASWRAERVRDFDSRFTFAGGIGGSWDGPYGFSLEADGGVSVAGDRAQNSWRLALGHGGESWHCSLGRESERGLVPWTERLSMVASSNPLLISDRDGRIDRWVVSAGWMPGGTWPEFLLQGEIYEMQGRLATRLPGDLPLVPVVQAGKGAGHRVAVIVRGRATGTWISLAWTEVQDRGDEAVLLDGAQAWHRRELGLRQRLGQDAWYGLAWHVLLNYEDGYLATGDREFPEGTRMALLAQRRVSGGLAVLF